MPYESLSEYVNALDKTGQLIHVKTKVNPDLEIAEIMRRLMYRGNQPAVLFESVEGATMPVLGLYLSGIADREKEGNKVVYRLKDKDIKRILSKTA